MSAKIPARGERIRVTKIYAVSGGFDVGDVVTVSDAALARHSSLWPDAVFVLTSDLDYGWIEFETEVGDTERPPAPEQPDTKLRARVARQRRELARLNRQARVNRLELERASRLNEDLLLVLTDTRRSLRVAEAKNDA